MTKSIAIIFNHLAYYENNIIPYINHERTDFKGFITSSLLTVRDSSLAIYNFMEHGNQPYTEGEKYLRLYGVLNAAYIQSESIKQIIKHNNLISNPIGSNILRDIDDLQIITLRNQIASHNNNYRVRNSKETESNIIERTTLSDYCLTFGKCGAHTRHSRLNLKELLHKYIESICINLDKINKESINNIQLPDKLTQHSRLDAQVYLDRYEKHYNNNTRCMNNNDLSNTLKNNYTQCISKYCRFYMNYILDRVWTKKDNVTVKKHFKLNKDEDWNFITSSLDTISDTCLSIDDFIHSGYIGNSGCTDIFCNTGEKYLRLYGFLNALYIQAEAVFVFGHRNHLTGTKQIDIDIKKLKILKTRNKLAAHNSNHNNNLESYSISPESLKGYTVGFICNMKNSTYEEVYINDLLIEYFSFFKNMLYNTCIQAVDTAYKNNKKQKKKLKKELENIKNNKEDKNTCELVCEVTLLDTNK